MSRSRKKPKPWSQNPDWRPRGFACYDSEWLAYKEAAALHGTRVNGWIRLWLNEAVLFERANARDKEDLESESTGP